MMRDLLEVAQEDNLSVRVLVVLEETDVDQEAEVIEVVIALNLLVTMCSEETVVEEVAKEADPEMSMEDVTEVLKVVNQDIRIIRKVKTDLSRLREIKVVLVADKVDITMTRILMVNQIEVADLK